MRPLKLTISAFGTFAKAEIINFDKIGKNGIYLICGDTGAGKTTIFDAISFALYGELSGDNRESKMMRSDFAAVDIDTYVELEFLCNDKKYRVRRSPEYSRPKKRGVGLVKSTPKGELVCISDDDNDDVLANKSKDVTDAIIKILGITRKQFSQIVMIAQGDFLKLLLSDTEDKQDILRKIFETNRFVAFQNILSNKKSEIIEERKFILNSLNILISGIKIDEDISELDESKEIQNAVLYNADLIKNIQKIISLQKEKKDNKTEISNKLIKNRDDLNDYISKAELINKDFLDYEKLIKDLKIMHDQKLEYDKYRVKYEKAEKAEYRVKPWKDNYNKEKKQLNALIKDIETLKEKKISIDNKMNELKSDINKIENKNKEIDMLNISIDEFEKNSDKYQELEKKEKLILSINSFLDIKNKEVENLKTSKAKKEEQSNKIKELFETYKNIDVEISTNENEKDKLNVKVKKIETSLELYETIVSNSKTYEKSLALYNKSNDNYKLKNSQYEDYAEKLFRERAGILAKDLKDGLPCPVCGSKDHPLIAKLTNDDLSEKNLKKLEKEKNDLNIKREELSKECGNIKTANDKDESSFLEMSNELLDIKEQKNEINKINKKNEISEISEISEKNKINEIETQRKYLEDMLSKSKNEIDELQNKYKELKSKKTELEEKERELKEILSILADLPNKISELNEDINKKNDEISAEKATFDFIKKSLKFDSLSDAKKDYDSNLTNKKEIETFIKNTNEKNQYLTNELVQSEAKLEEKEKTKEGQEKEVEATNKDYIKRLKEHFEDEQDYKDSILDPKTISEYKDKVKAYNDNIANIKGRKDSYEEKLKDKKKEDLSLKIEERDNLSIEIEALSKNIAEISSTISNNEKNRDSIAENIEKNKIKEEYYLMISSLSDTANGTLSGKGKITFETYIQMSYFGEIIDAANLRFDTMTDGRYYLVHNKNIGVQNKKIGLEISVMDNHTGRERDVKTLSGGESFKASLALALGLSDVVQRRSGGIKIDSMFIDEGFGSLDSDSLEGAIEVLTGLSSSNCIVGIISHVSELKDRIDKKIKVKKSSSGSSIEEEF